MTHQQLRKYIEYRITHTFSSDTSKDFKLLPTTRNSSSNSTILLRTIKNTTLERHTNRKCIPKTISATTDKIYAKLRMPATQ